MIVRHLRRHVLNPEGGFYLLRCDCGWEGRVPGGGRDRRSADRALEQIYRHHLGPDELRAYLLVDTRRPAELPPDAGPMIEGVWVMPIGEPVELVSATVVDGVHHGSYKGPGGAVLQLPVGEVRTAGGEVYRLGQ